jgi:hypothetical protein
VRDVLWAGLLGAAPDKLANVTDIDLQKQWEGFAGPFGRAVGLMRLGSWSDRSSESAATREAEAELFGGISGRLLRSVSHSRSGGGSCLGLIGLVSDEAFQIGLDIEHRRRAMASGIEPRLRKRLAKPQEERFGLSILETWVIKEACFKANPANLGTVVAGYEIQDFDRSSGEGAVLAPVRDTTARAAIRFKIVEIGDWKVGFAVSLARET